MDISLINSQSLLHLLSLTEKKEELLQVLEQIDAEIIRTLQGGISVEVLNVAPAPAIAAPAPKAKLPVAAPAKPAKKAKTAKPGGLKGRVLALLEAAGDQGLKVREIADKLGAKPGNIAVWFSTTGKHITTKLAPGRFARKGAAKAAAAAPVAKAAKPAKAKKKGGITPEGRARLAANMKARWAARKAGKSAAKAR